jgi:hypothetical protein
MLDHFVWCELCDATARACAALNRVEMNTTYKHIDETGDGRENGEKIVCGHTIAL